MAIEELTQGRIIPFAGTLQQPVHLRINGCHTVESNIGIMVCQKRLLDVH